MERYTTAIQCGFVGEGVMGWKGEMTARENGGIISNQHRNVA